MKSKVFQKITAWIQAQQEARAERRHRRALIQEDRRRKRQIEQLCWELSRKPLKVSSLKYNISIEPPKISKSAREQIGLGRKFELVVKDRERVTDGEVVSLTLHWKSPKKPRYCFKFDIADFYAPATPPPFYAESAAWPLDHVPRAGIKPLPELTELTPEKILDKLYNDVKEAMKAQQERLAYFVPGVKLPNTK